MTVINALSDGLGAMHVHDMYRILTDNKFDMAKKTITRMVTKMM